MHVQCMYVICMGIFVCIFIYDASGSTYLCACMMLLMHEYNVHMWIWYKWACRLATYYISLPLCLFIFVHVYRQDPLGSIMKTIIGDKFLYVDDSTWKWRKMKEAMLSLCTILLCMTLTLRFLCGFFPWGFLFFPWALVSVKSIRYFHFMVSGS